eukprot:gene22937-biopygen8327
MLAATAKHRSLPPDSVAYVGSLLVLPCARSHFQVNVEIGPKLKDLTVVVVTAQF